MNALSTPIAPVMVFNPQGQGPFVLACDHASNRIPDGYHNLGLTHHQRLLHIAWDPGALPVALRLSDALDAPLVAGAVSRLMVDCNRDARAHDLIPGISERIVIPGNAEISDAERATRIATWHRPFHGALDELLEQRRAAGQETIFVTIHSFTPVFKDVPRPWPIGLIHGERTRMTEAFRDALAADDPGLAIGWNQPYSGRSGVTYTLEHHGDGRGLDSTMIEIRHDGILDEAGIADWSERLRRALLTARDTIRFSATAQPGS